jgi:preprotein translocase subunit SecA
MSIALPRPGTPGLGHPLAGDSGRASLWPAVSRGAREVVPPKPLDFISERLGGWRARRAIARLGIERSESILAAARALRDIGSQGMEIRAREARERVVVERQSSDAVDSLFALGVEAIRRTLGYELHPVQVLAGLTMAGGGCAELATGEGKTATAILPAALMACAARGVHVITVNDYLAQRDSELNAEGFALLGFRVGLVSERSDHAQRRAAYAADITYATDKQMIFDHLRDRLHAPLRPTMNRLLLDSMLGPGSQLQDPAPADWPDRLVHRGLYAAIVDEADSVLIDEAVTPAIISEGGPSGEMPAADALRFITAMQIARQLTVDRHYRTDIGQRRAELTAEGLEAVDAACRSLPTQASRSLGGARMRREMVNLALAAKDLYARDDEYIVRDQKVMIVDRSTGRVLEGRQWQLGLHQAVEAKEGVPLTPERRTSARSSYQSFFRRYRHLAGMSGTCWEVRHELWAYYGLAVRRIPTHRPIIRTRDQDLLFPSIDEKLSHATKLAMEHRAAGRPVLIGTRSVATSERLGQLLQRGGIDAPVLNANREAEESAIVARAGVSGAITVATNMAGRGTDIRLDDASRAAGGLVIIATERHEESRVDRQLFGRSGRQGDPGHTVALVSLEDDLVRRHAPQWLVRMLERSGPLARWQAARWIWPLIQRAAGRHAVMIRAESFKAEAKFDLALQYTSK